MWFHIVRVGHFGRVRAKVRINILNQINWSTKTSWFELRTCDEHGESSGSRQERIFRPPPIQRRRNEDNLLRGRPSYGKDTYSTYQVAFLWATNWYPKCVWATLLRFVYVGRQPGVRSPRTSRFNGQPQLNRRAALRAATHLAVAHSNEH